MIRRIGKDDKEAVMLYLRSALVNSINICSKIKKYGFDGDELYVYADFWSDGEIKYVFSVFQGTVSVFSVSDEVETLDIYVYLRDNFIGYKALIGEESKVRGFMRHTLFRQQEKIDLFLANTRSFREPEFEENRAMPARVGDAKKILSLIESKVPKLFDPTKEELAESIKAYGAYIIKNEQGEITAAAVVADKSGRMVEIAVYSTSANTHKEDIQMVLSALTNGVLKKKYACCCKSGEVIEKQMLKSMGFQAVGTDLYLAR